MTTVRGDATEASEMGDAVMRSKTDRTFRRRTVVALAAAVVAWAAAAATAQTTPSAAGESAPAEILRLDVIEAAPGARVEIGASEAVVWTTFRDADGNLVIEL